MNNSKNKKIYLRFKGISYECNEYLCSHEIDLSDSKSSRIPNQFSKVNQYNSLNFSNNRLIYVPSYFENIKIKTLNLSNNKFDDWGKIPNLRSNYLYIDNNKLNNFKNMSYLNETIFLSLKYNYIETLKGMDGKKLPFLKSLDLSNNNLENLNFLPKDINLENLYVCNNKLINVDDINNHKLEYLYLSNNNIESLKNLLPNEKLKHLILDDNKITSLEDIGVFPNVEILSIKRNRINSLKGIEKLKKLTKIQFEGNDINEFSGITNDNFAPILYEIYDMCLGIPSKLKKIDKIRKKNDSYEKNFEKLLYDCIKEIHLSNKKKGNFRSIIGENCKNFIKEFS